MPVLSIQRTRCRPADIISVTSRILEFVDWAFGSTVKFGEAVDVGIPGVGFINFERASIDFVHAETAVEVGKGRDAGADPARGLSVGRSASGAVIGVIDHNLVFMGVTEEDVGNNMG